MIVIMCNSCGENCTDPVTQKNDFALLENEWAINENFSEEHHLCKDCFMKIIKDFKKV